MTNAYAPSRCALTRQCGMSLIEVLVAALVLSVGLLGLASLQAVAIRFNHSALLRTQADNLAHEILDAMRANIQSAKDGDYDRDYGDTWPTVGPNSPIADIDLANWGTRISEQLPAGEGELDVTHNAPSTVANVRIHWQEREVGDDTPTPPLTEFSFQTRL